ncbi:MAG: acyl--CoA ligase [Candidatus Binataceae bacterium]
MAQKTTLAELLADPASPAPAIIASDPPMVVSYKALAEQIEWLAGQLRSAGLRPGESVAIVLHNGLEFLVVFLALARARIVAAPLNPAYKASELRFFLEDGQARTVIADPDNTAVKEAAAELGLAIWSPRVDSTGAVELAELERVSGAGAEPPYPDDVALFLHTSGTTSRPKGVPLTHANVLGSSLNIAAHYALTPGDRSLVVMPLFHVHGLIGAAFSTLVSGGAVIVPPRFSASAFWGLFHEHLATWYSAVPTINQVLLARADSDGAPSGGPRFIRSCSSALAPAILAKLEHRFGAPVLEAYGMTEAAHQVASNPLPPLPHKPGTVGRGTAVEIAIIDDTGRHLAANTAGEVAIRGANVMHGYRNNPEANAAAFIDGWFRTGDNGVLDDDGYLALIGRIKELINRGGEKISPAEVDAALLGNPAVAEAAAFGVPDTKYGEEVWAAVVLKSDATADQLAAHCRSVLADFKVPKAIHIVSALPKTATGKIQRRALASLFKAGSK